MSTRYPVAPTQNICVECGQPTRRKLFCKTCMPPLGEWQKPSQYHKRYQELYKKHVTRIGYSTPRLKHGPPKKLRHEGPLHGPKAPTDRVELAATIAAFTQHSDRCLVWPLGITNDGYGHLLSWGGRNIQPHRLVLILSTGEEHEDKHVAHHPTRCHIRSCVNPRHLRWATPAENRQDIEVRRRWQADEILRLTEENAELRRQLSLRN